MSRVENYLTRLPISRKLLFLIIGVVFTIALLATTVLIVSALHIARNYYLPANIHAAAGILTNPVIAEQLMQHPDEAQETLRSAADVAMIKVLALYDDKGKLYQGISTDPTLFPIPEQLPKTPPKNSAYHLQTLSSGTDQPGTLYIVADPSLPIDFYTSMGFAGLIIISFCLLILLVTSLIRRFITQPVLHLIKIANTVSIEENYRVRAQRFYSDEIGILATAFNTMLSRIEARDQLLTSARDKAERASMRAQSLATETRKANRKLELEVEVRKKVEHKLTGFQDYLNNIIDSMPSALIAVDEQLTVMQWNHAASAMANIAHGKGAGQALLQALPCLKPFTEQIQRALTSNQQQRVSKASLLDHNYVHELVIYPLKKHSGSGAVIRIDDITERVHMQEMMVQSEKMLSVGGLAAGMAHEINNPLGGILQGVQNIRRRLSMDLVKNQSTAESLQLDMESILKYIQKREIDRFLDNISDAGERASAIVANMLQFSRRSARTLVPCDLSELVRRTLEIAHNDLSIKQGFDIEGIELKLSLDPNLSQVPCIANEIEQVLLNLIKNAVQAIMSCTSQRKGVVTITTSSIGDEAVITVKDNGAGMTNKVSKRVFEPFFTTKDIGSGTGLGLSVSYFIITNNHSGKMMVKSRKNSGTEFIIKLQRKPALLPAPA